MLSWSPLDHLTGPPSESVYDFVYFKIKDLGITWRRVLKALTLICGTTFLFSIVLVIIQVHLSVSILNFFVMFSLALFIYIGINYGYSRKCEHTAMEELKNISKTFSL